MLTGDVPVQDVRKLLDMALEKNGHFKPDFNWDKPRKVLGIGYSRGWLIVRRRHLELTAPSLLVPTAEILADARKEAEKAGKLMEHDDLQIMGAIVRRLRLENKGISWGEIAVRMDVPESLVRKCFRHGSVLKDKGLRIGKGGRWAYGDPTLYTEHRQSEGAAIPADVRGRPTVDQLLNGDHKLNRKPLLSERVAQRRAPRKARAKKAVSQPEPTEGE